MKTSTELLIGIKISMENQFIKLYDVNLPPANEAELDLLKEEFLEVYGKPENIKAYMKKLRVIRKVPKSKVFVFFKKALVITKNKTKEILTDILPEKEHIIIKVVKNNGNDDNLKWA